jgi:hypothetical protein
MKTTMVVLFLAVLVLMYYYHTKHPYDPNASQPVIYTKSLQNDVKKADEAAAKAQAAIDKTLQETQKASQDAEPK